MKRFIARLRCWLRNEWREIGSAPFDREIEVAIVEDDVRMASGLRLRRADGWIDSETLQPVQMKATHWRYRLPALLPSSCC
jgi:hypothetical protein